MSIGINNCTPLPCLFYPILCVPETIHCKATCMRLYRVNCGHVSTTMKLQWILLNGCTWVYAILVWTCARVKNAEHGLCASNDWSPCVSWWKYNVYSLLWMVVGCNYVSQAPKYTQFNLYGFIKPMCMRPTILISKDQFSDLCNSPCCFFDLLKNFPSSIQSNIAFLLPWQRCE